MLKFLSKISLQSVAWINPQSKVDNSYKDILFSTPLEKGIADLAYQCAEKGFSVDALSEISVRLSTDKFAVSRQNAGFRNLTKQDFHITALENAFETPSISACRHILWHALVYRNTPAKYTLFCQPVHAMVYANFGKKPQPSEYPDLSHEMIRATSITAEESALTMAIKDFQIILIKGFGLLVWAEEMNDLLSKVELLEFSSKLALIGIN